jgi:hypothetical protein
VTNRPDGAPWRRHDASPAPLERSDAWQNFALELERYIDAGEDRVLLPWHERGRANASGVPRERDGVSVYTLSDGRIATMLTRLDRAEALRELGL